MNFTNKNIVLIVLIISFWGLGNALVPGDVSPSTTDFDLNVPEETTQSILWEKLIMHRDDWYKSQEALQIAENILIYQRGSGGWPKNIDFTEPISNGKKKELLKYINEPLSTIDNGATFTQMRFLAKVYNQTNDSRYRISFLKGLDYLLKAQYDNGGWPQYYPLRKGYYTHITYNDDAMIGVMRLLRDVASGVDEYRFVDENRQKKATVAVQKGIDCILKTQVVVNGKLTAWCAQHNEKTFKPARARAYELVSLSGKESVGIVWFLMELKNPSPEIISAIEGAINWFEEAKIEGIRQKRVRDSRSPTGFNKIVVEDPGAPAMWARFYQIGTNRPFFSDRDGKIYYNLADISFERRNDYAWLGYWPKEMLEDFYPVWQARLTQKSFIRK